MRIKSFLLLSMALSAPALVAQTGYSSFCANNVKNASGQKLAAGDVTITPEDIDRNAANFRIGGPDGGTGTRAPVKGVVINGVIKRRVDGSFVTCIPVADSGLTVPANVRYHVEIRDNTANTGQSLVVDIHHVRVTGATWSLDEWTFPDTNTGMPPPSNEFNGGNVDGDLHVTGTVQAGALTGNGSGVTNLNADNITSGTLNAARLPGTIGSNTTGNAATATNAGHATTADSATNATHATAADSATNATNASHATSADTATNASHATSADSATNASSTTNTRTPCPAGQVARSVDANFNVVCSVMTADEVGPGFTINSFNCAQTVELGATITNPVCTASYSSTPSSANITNTDGVSSPTALSSPFTSGTITGSFTKSSAVCVTLTLTAIAGLNPTRTQQFCWLPRVFGGVGNAGATGATASGSNAVLSSGGTLSGTTNGGGLTSSVVGRTFGPYTPSNQKIYIIAECGRSNFTSGPIPFVMNSTSITYTNALSASGARCIYESPNPIDAPDGISITVVN